MSALQRAGAALSARATSTTMPGCGIPVHSDMHLNDRWIWLGERHPLEETGVAIFRLYPGCWQLAYGSEALGPFEDRSILRAARIACTPCIDGCELGPSQLGIRELSSPRRPLRRGPHWQQFVEGDLPQSVTLYDKAALEPVRGCCTTFEAMPKVVWQSIDGWESYVDSEPVRGGQLRSAWNAHPPGSLLLGGNELAVGFAIVDLP